MRKRVNDTWEIGLWNYIFLKLEIRNHWKIELYLEHLDLEENELKRFLNLNAYEIFQTSREKRANEWTNLSL